MERGHELVKFRPGLRVQETVHLRLVIEGGRVGGHEELGPDDAQVLLTGLVVRVQTGDGVPGPADDARVRRQRPAELVLVPAGHLVPALGAVVGVEAGGAASVAVACGTSGRLGRGLSPESEWHPRRLGFVRHGEEGCLEGSLGRDVVPGEDIGGGDGVPRSLVGPCLAHRAHAAEAPAAAAGDEDEVKALTRAHGAEQPLHVPRRFLGAGLPKTVTGAAEEGRPVAVGSVQEGVALPHPRYVVPAQDLLFHRRDVELLAVEEVGEVLQPPADRVGCAVGHEAHQLAGLRMDDGAGDDIAVPCPR